MFIVSMSLDVFGTVLGVLQRGEAEIRRGAGAGCLNAGCEGGL